MQKTEIDLYYTTLDLEPEYRDFFGKAVKGIQEELKRIGIDQEIQVERVGDDLLDRGKSVALISWLNFMFTKYPFCRTKFVLACDEKHPLAKNARSKQNGIKPM